MRNLIARTTGLREAENAVRTMLRREPGTPGVVMIWGEVGRGKTTAARHIAVHGDAVLLEALPDWTSNWMLGDLAVELGAARSWRTEANFRAVVGALREHPRALCIDEADRLTRRLALCETLRAVHDATGAPLVLIGMEQLPSAVSRLPQLRSRVASWIEFRPLDAADVALIARDLCEITLDDEALAHLHELCAGSARALCVALERLERLARRQGVSRLRWREIPAGYELHYSRRPTRGARAANGEPAAKEAGNAAA